MSSNPDAQLSALIVFFFFFFFFFFFKFFVLLEGHSQLILCAGVRERCSFSSYASVHVKKRLCVVRMRSICCRRKIEEENNEPSVDCFWPCCSRWRCRLVHASHCGFGCSPCRLGRRETLRFVPKNRRARWHLLGSFVFRGVRHLRQGFGRKDQEAASRVCGTRLQFGQFERSLLLSLLLFVVEFSFFF